MVIKETFIVLKLLLLYSYTPSYLSGFFTEIANKLVEEGHVVYCFCLKKNKDRFKRDGVTYIVGKRGSYFKNYLQVYNIIRGLDPEVVLSNFSYVNPALFFGKLLGVKKNIAWEHSLNHQKGATSRQIFVKRFFFRLSDIVIANSHITKKELHDVYKLPLDQIVPIPFWTPEIDKKQELDLDSLTNYKSKYFKIGCPGRLADHKNQKLVINVLAEFPELLKTQTAIYFAGVGKEEKELKALVKELGLETQVHFLGLLSSSEMQAFYSTMDVIVLPSLYEAFGLVFIEAISMDKPVLVSKAFGALTFIDQIKYDMNDFVFDPSSVENLKQLLMQQINSEFNSVINFKELYLENFDKYIIYHKIKDVLLTNSQ